MELSIGNSGTATVSVGDTGGAVGSVVNTGPVDMVDTRGLEVALLVVVLSVTGIVADQDVL